MFQTHLDHLVVTAPSLPLGVEYVQDVLAVSMHPGGEHSQMGTHNCLLRLGNAVYLEVISIDPGAEKPGRPRWFNLDAVDQNSVPHLAAWVARTDDIHGASAAVQDSFGILEPMQRGAWHWLITIPVDGSLPMNGIAPMLIEWASGPHPASTLPVEGCSLIKLEGFHPQAAQIAELLQLINFQDEIILRPIPSSEPSFLSAQILTPSGIRQLSGS